MKLCPPGFKIQRQPRLSGWRGGTAVVYRNVGVAIFAF